MSLRLLTAALLLPLVTASQAADFNAEEFLSKNCTQCHDSSVYTRPDRKVTSLEALDTQVRRCDSMIGTKLFDDDVHSLVEHLNSRFYHF